MKVRIQKTITILVVFMMLGNNLLSANDAPNPYVLDDFSLETDNNQYHFKLSLEGEESSGEIVQPQVHIRNQETQETEYILDMDLVSENDTGLVLETIIDQEVLDFDFDASFSIDLGDESVSAFNDENWIRSIEKQPRVTGKWVSHISEIWSKTGRFTSYATYTLGTDLNMVRVKGQVFDGVNYQELLIEDFPVPTNQEISSNPNGQRFVGFVGEFDKQQSNRMVKVMYTLVYANGTEVRSSIQDVHITSVVDIDPVKSTISSSKLHLEAEVYSLKKIDPIINEISVEIRAKGTTPWIAVPTSAIKDLGYNSVLKKHDVTVDASFIYGFVPNANVVYEVKLNVMNRINTTSGAVIENKAFGINEMKFAGAVYTDIYSLEDGNLGRESQDYSVGVKPNIQEVYTVSEVGVRTRQYEYVGWSRTLPNNMDEVSVSEAPAFTAVNESIYLIYQPVVKLVQLPEVFKFAPTKSNDPSLSSALYLQDFNQENLDTGRSMVLALANKGALNEAFDVYASLSAFTHDLSGDVRNDFSLRLAPDVVQIADYGKASQHLLTKPNGPSGLEVVLESGGSSQRIMSYRESGTNDASTAWALKFSETNSSITRPANANSGTYSAEVVWELKTGLKVSE